MTWKRLPYCAAFVLAPMLGACEPGDTPEQDHVEETRTEGRSAPAPLMPIDHSGVTGTAMADKSDGQVTITLSLEGLLPGTLYLASAHSNRCAANEPPRVPLGRITGDDDGTASVELRADAQELPERYPWSVQVQSEAGETVACADIVEL